MKYCQQCGNAVDDNSAFCGKCGAKIQEVETRNFSPERYIPDETFSDMFFKRDGRLNRLRYFKRCMLVGLITNIPVQILTQMLLESSSNFSTSISILIFLISVCGIASAYLFYGLFIRRSHDFPKDSFFADIIAKDDTKPAKIILTLNLMYAVLFSLTSYYAISKSASGVTVLGAVSTILLILAVILDLYFLFKGGEKGANKFEPDPLGKAVYPNDPRAYNPQNYQNFAQNSYSSQNSQSTSGTDKTTTIFWVCVSVIILVVVVVGISSQDSSKNYTPSSNPSYKRTSDNSDYQRNQSSVTPNSNNSSNYNFQFNDNNGNSYNAVSNYRGAFGIIQINTSKEIYCDFDKNPRARGMFHEVGFAVSNGTNDPIFIGDVYLIDDRGRKYADDINATTTKKTMMNFEGPSQINLGQVVVNFSIFDIPDNVNIVKVRYEEVFEQPIEVPYQVSKN